MDMRGHGLSTGKRAYMTRFSHLVDDAQRFIEQKVLTADGMNPSKLLLWGQSYGGLLAPHVYLRMKPQLGTDTLGGLLLTSCAVGVDKTLIMKLQTPLGPCVSALLPKIALTPAVSPSMMSSDPEADTTGLEHPGYRSAASIHSTGGSTSPSAGGKISMITTLGNCTILA